MMRGMTRTVAVVLSALAWAEPGLAGYDPLATPSGFQARTLDLTVRDAARSRDIPVLVYLPEAEGAAPVVLFSHGLGGTRRGSAYLAKHWAARGYVAVFLQHPGSDGSVWRGERLANRMDAMRRAASGRNLLQRARDVPAVLDQLERWSRQDGHALAGRMDLQRVGMSGHSFGAVTTQAVSGQAFLGGRAQLTDRRIGAAIAFSQSSPR
ncbi:MAG TPA: hypothetical protein VLH79_07080 [Chthonomonadales bacterium]|nr:hypothetical protein [Chthonomonadales bacterium]